MLEQQEFLVISQSVSYQVLTHDLEKNLIGVKEQVSGEDQKTI